MHHAKVYDFQRYCVSKNNFQVKVLGTPKPSLQWFKDDMEVFSSERLDIREEEDGGIVVVKEVIINKTIIIQEITQKNLKSI